jgi:Ser/Thr protein kinase RdoA (MazF antagonist)
VVTHDLRPSFVSCPTLLRWVSANVADGLMNPVRANDLRRQIHRLNSHWVEPDDLPVQIIHTDPHAGNIVAIGADEFVYLDFGGVESAPRIHDVAIAFTYLLAATSTTPEEMLDQLPALLDAYATGAQSRLRAREDEALAVYTAAVAIYYDICDWGHGWSAISARLLDSAIP